MPLDQHPVHRKIIIPWYDSDSICLITLASLLLGILSCFPRPYAAGIAGLVALISLPVTMLTRFRSQVTMLAWWVILGVYLITSLVAIATRSPAEP